MTSILKQENGELFIYKGNEVFPELRRGNTPESITYRRDWFAAAERIKVAEDKDTFLFQLRSRGHLLCLNDHLGGFLEAGIEIPGSCYEVREVENELQKKTGHLLTKENLAYFKDDRATEKETGLNSEIASRHINYGNKSYLEPDRPHENTSLDPKEHAIQFAEWASEDEWEYWEGHWHKTIPVARMGDDCFDMLTYSSEQLYNQFINRK